MKELLNKYIDGISKEILAMADSIFDDPELGLNEFRAMKKIFMVLKQLLEQDTLLVREA